MPLLAISEIVQSRALLGQADKRAAAIWLPLDNAAAGRGYRRRTGAGLVHAYAGEIGVRTLLQTRIIDASRHLAICVATRRGFRVAMKRAGEPADFGSAVT